MNRMEMKGLLRVKITTADIPRTLSLLAERGARAYKVRRTGNLEVCLEIPREQMQILQEVCEKMGNSVKLRGVRGMYWKVRTLLHRPVLLLAGVFLMAFTVFLSRRVLFYEVVGNEKIPQDQILEVAQSCGLEFGAIRKTVRSEAVKNKMLSSLESLQWVGINTQGCVATIRVREREELPPQQVLNPTANLVASQDGVITRVVLQTGNARCQVGQAVKKGQLLISPYTDCGFKILAQQPKGEVFALTQRLVSCVTPSETLYRLKKTHTQRVFAIQFGKNRINLSNRSGISPSTCAKIETVKQLTLPGGFALPVYWICRERQTYETVSRQLSAQLAQERLQGFALQVLTDSMEKGTVMSQAQRSYERDGVYCLETLYACEEMIAQSGGSVFEGD